MIFKEFFHRSIKLAGFVGIVTALGAAALTNGKEELTNFFYPYKPLTEAEISSQLKQATSIWKEQLPHVKELCESDRSEQIERMLGRRTLAQCIATRSQKPQAEWFIQTDHNNYEMTRHEREDEVTKTVSGIAAVFYGICFLIFGYWLITWLKEKPRSLAINQIKRVSQAVEMAAKADTTKTMSAAARAYADLESLRNNGLISEETFSKRKEQLRASLEAAANR